MPRCCPLWRARCTLRFPCSSTLLGTALLCRRTSAPNRPWRQIYPASPEKRPQRGDLKEVGTDLSSNSVEQHIRDLLWVGAPLRCRLKFCSRLRFFSVALSYAREGQNAWIVKRLSLFLIFMVFECTSWNVSFILGAGMLKMYLLFCGLIFFFFLVFIPEQRLIHFRPV